MLFRICVACDHTNPPESRFCGKCGAPLQVRFCRLCRSPNDAVSRYCQSCGTELPELTSAEESTPPTAPRPATIPPLVVATPGRPISDAAAASLQATTISATFSGGEAGAPDADRAGTRRPDSDARPAIDVLPAQSARARPVAVDAVTTSLPVVIDARVPPARSWRAPRIAAVLAIAAIVATFGAFAFKAWRAGSANQRPDRAEVPAAPQPAATVGPAPTAGADQTNAAPPAPAPAPATQAAPPPAARTAKSAPRERRDVAPPGAGRTAVAPAPAPALAPALRECTPPVAALGLCTPEPKPEGN
jgi:hypothetical protein